MSHDINELVLDTYRDAYHATLYWSGRPKHAEVEQNMTYYQKKH